MNRISLLVALGLLLANGAGAHAAQAEQTTFNADEAQPLVSPLPIPRFILKILEKDETVEACAKDNPIDPTQPLRAWFVASAIHLHGSGEEDVVILPRVAGERYLCFHSAEGIGWFWVFQPTRAGQYQLVLKASGLRLRVLDTQHKGYRDIRTDGQVGKFGTMTVFRFEAGRYHTYQKRTTPSQ